jgi:hypothetical protein
MEKLLKKENMFQWNKEFQEGLGTLKQKLVTMLILIFPYWKKEFHVHMDASSVSLGVVLFRTREGYTDHPFSFARRNLSTT